MKLVASVTFIFTLAACNPAMEKRDKMRLMTLDPGHFHAALVQKKMYPSVDSVVHVYAPPGPDLDLHMGRINAYNTRADNPTRWHSEVYNGDNYFQRMLKDRRGDVVVMAGKNENKTENIFQSISAGYHVLADKPMAITPEDFALLEESFSVAADKNRLLYDIMTERYEITTMLQRAFSMEPDVFGVLEKGTPDNPAVTKESVHHFYKYVSGSVLRRPAWFMDVRQQGHGLVDVTTHLVDLIQWECFPGEMIDYKKDIADIQSTQWPTLMTRSQFSSVTGLSGFPDYLQEDVKDSVLNVMCNGEIIYSIRGIYAKASVIWAYRAPEGAGDTHYSVMRGTRANLVIRQGAEQNYSPVLYIEPILVNDTYSASLKVALANIHKQFPGVHLKPNDKGWEVVIPDQYKEGHEAHFARVMEKFIEYVNLGELPDWEVPNMLAKYYTTTSALSLARTIQK